MRRKDTGTHFDHVGFIILCNKTVKDSLKKKTEKSEKEE